MWGMTHSNSRAREAEILEFVGDDVYVGPDSYKYGTYFIQEKN